MERPPPPPPFPFPNTNSSSSQTWYFHPSFDHSQVLLPQQDQQDQPYSNFSSPAPPHFAFAPQQQMMAPPANYADYSSSAPVPPPYPFSAPMNNYYWPIQDPSAAPLSYQPIDHYQYFGQQNKVASDASAATKAARSRRKIARQKSIMTSSSRSSSSSATTLFPISQNDYYHEKIPVVVDHHHHHQGIKDDDSCIIFSDNKKLKLVFKKKLKTSDVSQLGRIVIPKKDAEENLPPLTGREGIKLVVRDLNSDRQWILKYKYWSNNKSRMYVLEHTGDFLRKNGLKMDDTIIFYVDEHNNYFFSAERVGWEKQLEGAISYETQEEEYRAAEEEDAALALMIENLRQSDVQEEAQANNLLTLSMGMTHHDIIASSSSTSTSQYHHQAAGVNLWEQEQHQLWQEEFGNNNSVVNHYDMTLPFLDTCWMGPQ